MSLCVHRLRHSFPDTTFASRECFLNMRCCPNRQSKSAPEQNQITRKLATSKLANWILCVCQRCHPLSYHVYQIYLDWFYWGHAFCRKCIGRESRTAGNRQGCQGASDSRRG